MPQQKGTRKRGAERPADAEASEVSDTQAPAPKKPRGLGRATRSGSGTPSVVISEASTAKGKETVSSIAEETENEEETEEGTETGRPPGPWPFNAEEYLNNNFLRRHGKNGWCWC